MIPYDIDPTLYSVQPQTPVLDDGFSPKHAQEPEVPAVDEDEEAGQEDTGLGPKSLF